ncbi:HNH nuclease [Lactiplantibacillus plantarum]|nr:HNH nuclease [Lactiplantibacillus plantarum]MCG0855637.1 HNH nuclease [Lactiplantibacillus plantarum]
MAAMIHSKYGYEPPEWVQADARLDKWYKDKKRREKKRRKQHAKDKKMPLS